MHFKSFALIPLLLTSSFALNELDKSILSSDRQKSIELSGEQAEADSSALKRDWINPITYKYTQLYDVGSNDYDTAKSYIGVSQPIFKSGGIYSAIKYAYAMEKYSSLNVELQKQTMIKDALNILFQIQRTTFNIQKQELLVKNSEIDVETKREQVLNGVIDTSDLNNAIISLNNNRNTYLELEYSKEELINSFANYSDSYYNNFELPSFSMVDEKDFESNNINLQVAKSDIKAKNHYSSMINSQFLPTVNATYDYTKYHDDGGASSSYVDDKYYGFNITIPIDLNSLDESQSAKIDYLQAKISLNNIVKSEKNFLKNKLAKIKMLDKKLKIATNDVKLYDSLLSEVKELQSVGMRTSSDVQTFENSKKIKAIDIKIHGLDKQVELLELYAKMYRAAN